MTLSYNINKSILFGFGGVCHMEGFLFLPLGYLRLLLWLYTVGEFHLWFVSPCIGDWLIWNSVM